MAEQEKKTEVTSDVVPNDEKKTDIEKTGKSETKKKKTKKPGFFTKAAKWIRELIIEAKKVVWPTGRSVAKNTLVVIILVIIVSAFVAFIDFVFGGIRDLLATLLGNLF